MIAPNGFLNFFEIAEWAREVARDLAWAKRIVPDAGGGRRLDQVPGERDAIECWAMANFIANPFVTICSASGVVMRAPDALNKHLDQIEILPIPLPIEDSSLELPDFNKGFELGTRYYFRDRFAYFDWHTGCVDASRADGDTLIGITGESQFSNATTNYLLQRQSRMNMAITRLSGWSICVKEDSIGETVADMYSAFGVNRALLERLNLVDSGFFSWRRPQRQFTQARQSIAGI